MSGVCSKHLEPEPGCKCCETTPAQLLGVTEEEWARRLAEAEARGRYTCWRCGFEQYRSWLVCCVLCSEPYLERKLL